MPYIQPFIVGDYLFVEQISSTIPFYVHRVVDLSESEFSCFKSFKTVNPEARNHPVFSTDLGREAAALRALRHPAIPQFFDYGIVEGKPYLIYRYIWGKSLLQILRELRRHKKRLAQPYALFIAHELTRILSCAHAVRKKDFPHGITHANLSPRNIILSYSGKVNLVGIGHPGPMVAPEHLELLDFRYMSYLSPEQVARETVTFKTDIFTLGCILYEMLTGVPPFVEKSPEKVLHRIAKGSYAPASTVASAISPELDRILARALSVYPDDRWRSAEEMGNELDHFLAAHHAEFHPRKVAKLMKNLFDKDIVEDIRTFQNLAENLVIPEKTLLRSIPRRMFDEVQEKRKAQPAFSLQPTGGVSLRAASRLHASEISRPFDAISRVASQRPERQNPFFENEDQNLWQKPDKPLQADAGEPPRAASEPNVAASEAREAKSAGKAGEFQKADKPAAGVRRGGKSAAGEGSEFEEVSTELQTSVPLPALLKNTAVASPKRPEGDFIEELDIRLELVGEEIGEYTLTSILGWGGMGTVYEAVSRMTQERVAIKVLDAANCEDSDETQRFLREAMVVNALRNPHVIEFLGHGLHENKYHYIVMERLEGTTLGSYLQVHSALSAPFVHHVMEQVFDAVAAAHDNHIIHRDLKPDNIFLVERSGSAPLVKVLDFGIAKIHAPDTENITKTGAPMGTPHYMSPEQALGEPVTVASDIYSLGVILYEMLTGRLPFQKRTYLETLFAHIREVPPPPSQWVPMDAELERILLWTLEKKPEKRPQSVRELAQRLFPCLVRQR